MSVFGLLVAVLGVVIAVGLIKVSFPPRARCCETCGYQYDSAHCRFIHPHWGRSGGPDDERAWL